MSTVIPTAPTASTNPGTAADQAKTPAAPAQAPTANADTGKPAAAAPGAAAGATKTIFIAGSAANGAGISVLDASGMLRCLDTATSTQNWDTNTCALPGAAQGMLMCGDNTNGVAVFDGTAIRFLTNLCNPDAQWKNARPLPADVKVVSLTGDYTNGLTVAGEGNHLYQLSSLDGKADWRLLSPPPDFEIKMVAGDNKGLLLVGGSGGNRNQVARANNDCCSWTMLPAAPINIELICGTLDKNFVAYGEKQLYTLDAVKGVWSKLPRLGFRLLATAGNQKDGVVVVAESNVIAYCVDVTKGPWCIAKIISQPEPPETKPDTVQPASGPAAAPAPTKAPAAAARVGTPAPSQAKQAAPAAADEAALES